MSSPPRVEPEARSDPELIARARAGELRTYGRGRYVPGAGDLGGTLPFEVASKDERALGLACLAGWSSALVRVGWGRVAMVS